MNKEQRKRLADILQKIDECRSEIDQIKEEEQDKLDNIPENLQGSERYQNMEEGIDKLDSCFTNLDEAYDELEEAINI